MSERTPKLTIHEYFGERERDAEDLVMLWVNGRIDGCIECVPRRLADLFIAAPMLLSALEDVERELAVLSGPHIFFEVHSHFEYTHWLWESDSTFVEQGGFPWKSDDDTKTLLLEEYRDDLEAILSGRLSDGLAYGRIPVKIGKDPEDPQWEPIFARAIIIPLGFDEEDVLAKARAAVAAAKAKP